MKRLSQWMVCGLLLTSACVEQGRRSGANGGPSTREIDAVRARVASSRAPAPQNRLNVDFGGKVTLLGYDITPSVDAIRPGTHFTVKWYWQCNSTVGDGWKLFTHFDDAERPRENHDGDGDVRRLYQPERWRRGEYITDTQELEVPAGWEAPVLLVHLGFWKGDDRLPIRTAGAAQSENRLRAFEIRTGVARPTAPPPPPTTAGGSGGGPNTPVMTVPQTTTAPAIDGRLDDVAWRSAVGTGSLVNVSSGAPAGDAESHGNVRLLWDAQNLYMAWEVQDDNIVETGTTRDAHYWENDTTEVLIDPNGDGRDYYELQVSPGGHTFDSQQPTPPSGENFGNLAWNPNVRVAIVRNGTLGNIADNDMGYTVEVAIPWSEIGSGAAHTPPQVGDSWRVNFFLMDKPKSGAQRFAGWSAPRGGSFHMTDRFGTLSFGPVAGTPNPLLQLRPQGTLNIPLGATPQPAAAPVVAPTPVAAPTAAVAPTAPTAAQPASPNSVNPAVNLSPEMMRDLRRAYNQQRPHQ